MTESSVFIHRRGLAQLFNRRRLRVTAIATLLLALPMSLAWQDAKYSFFMRAFLVGFSAMLAFGLAEQWPRRLPRWLARWALQVMAVALVIPLCTFTIYVLSTKVGAPLFWHDGERRSGYMLLTILPLLVAPWVALTALVRQREAWAREQALAFELERSELSRQALEARMRLLRAQVQPHFLFNTLANVHALVETGSPRAATVLEHLIEYLRAAVPRLDETRSSLAQELELVRAYLALMQMRMPDRLQYEIDVAPGCERLACPPMCLLTLVENAVRHGIDPSEDGGQIRVRVWREAGLCHIEVSDTGLGLREGGSGLGTGLAALRERLAQLFGSAAQLSLHAVSPRGVRAALQWPAQEGGGMNRAPTALIADDEPLLREVLRRRLAEVWPALQIVAEARNGREAIELVERCQPDICFLDVQMPGVSGVEAARQIGRRAHLVFVTAFEQYALQAFEHGVLDYLVKPVTPTRLAETVLRLQERMDKALPAVHSEALLQQLATQLARAAGVAAAGVEPLRWVRANVQGALQMIPVASIAYLKADAKYTLVAWRDEAGRPTEALVRLALKELLAQLDPRQFAQVHRAVVVNLGEIQRVTRGDNETAEIFLKGRSERLPVSRSYLHLFREM